MREGRREREREKLLNETLEDKLAWMAKLVYFLCVTTHSNATMTRQQASSAHLGVSAKIFRSEILIFSLISSVIVSHERRTQWHSLTHCAHCRRELAESTPKCQALYQLGDLTFLNVQHFSVQSEHSTALVPVSLLSPLALLDEQTHFAAENWHWIRRPTGARLSV